MTNDDEEIRSRFFERRALDSVRRNKRGMYLILAFLLTLLGECVWVPERLLLKVGGVTFAIILLALLALERWIDAPVTNATRDACLAIRRTRSNEKGTKPR